MSARVISWSRLQMWRDCPAKYHFYAEGRPQAPVPLFEYGLRLHAAVQQYVEHCQQARVAQDYVFADAMASGVQDSRLRRAVLQFPLTITIRPDLFPQGLETEFEVPVGEWLLRGRIDRVEIEPDGTIRIQDYKSGFRPQYPKEPDLQLLTYAGAWQRLHGGERFRLRQVWPEADPNLPPPEWIVEGTVPLTHVEAVVRELEAATSWEPRPGQRACQSCPFLTTCCTAGEGIITSPEEAIAAYERAQRLLGAVRAYCADHYVPELPTYVAPAYIARGEAHYTIAGDRQEKRQNADRVVRLIFMAAAKGDCRLSSALEVKAHWLNREVGKGTALAEQLRPYLVEMPPRPRFGVRRKEES